MERPLVSIIMPVYNSAPYLKAALRCIEDQTLKDYELICVDDGSSDGSLSILNGHAADRPYMTVVSQSNMNAGVARNTGMKIAKGKYLLFLDSDDMFEGNFLEELVLEAERTDAEITVCDAYIYDDQTGIISKPTYYLRKEYLSRKGTFNRDDIPDHIWGFTVNVPWNKLFSHEFIDRSRLSFQDTRRNNDEYFVSMALAVAGRISVVDKRLVYYRINSGSSLQSYSDDDPANLDLFDALEKIRDGLMDEALYSLLEKSYINKVLTTFFSALYKQGNFSSFSRIYSYMKEAGLSRLGLDDADADIIGQNRKDFKLFKACGADEFVFKKWRQGFVYDKWRSGEDPVANPEP